MSERPFGLCAGSFTVPDDFDAPLPEEILRAFEGGWHLEIVRERLAEDERDPEDALPGEEFLAWLRQPR